jgi:hypothetical protein
MQEEDRKKGILKKGNMKKKEMKKYAFSFAFLLRKLGGNIVFSRKGHIMCK